MKIRPNRYDPPTLSQGDEDSLIITLVLCAVLGIIGLGVTLFVLVPLASLFQR